MQFVGHMLKIDLWRRIQDIKGQQQQRYINQNGKL
jgi:hypothetical protein